MKNLKGFQRGDIESDSLANQNAALLRETMTLICKYFMKKGKNFTIRQILKF